MTFSRRGFTREMYSELLLGRYTVKKISSFSAALCVVSVLACGDEPQIDATDAEIAEIIDNLIQAGFPEDDIMIEDGVVYVGRDAEVSLEASREMIEVDPNADGEEQYRTNNLVSLAVGTICIDGTLYDRTDFAPPIPAQLATLSTALDWSINNYNRLGLSFQMRRITTSTAGCDALITASAQLGSGGVAGFPSGGLPFNRITIGVETADLGTNTTEHVITHELGHCVGFRHSDFFDRSISCGEGGNEGSGGVGAILIPGTPSGAVVGGSIMNSCFRASETGEFTSTDVTALQTLY